MKVEDLMSVLCIGRNTAYELVRSGQIRSIRVGRNIRVPKEVLSSIMRKLVCSPSEWNHPATGLSVSNGNILFKSLPFCSKVSK